MKRNVYLEIIEYMQSLGPRCNLHKVAKLFSQYVEYAIQLIKKCRISQPVIGQLVIISLTFTFVNYFMNL